MPGTLLEWLWWFFTAIVAGLILTVVGNLLTPHIAAFVSSRTGRVRAMWLARSKKRAAFIEEMLQRISEDDKVLISVIADVQHYSSASSAVAVLDLLSLAASFIFLDSAKVPQDSLAGRTLVTLEGSTYELYSLLLGVLCLGLSVTFMWALHLLTERTKLYRAILDEVKHRYRVPSPPK